MKNLLHNLFSHFRKPPLIKPEIAPDDIPDFGITLPELPEPETVECPKCGMEGATITYKLFRYIKDIDAPKPFSISTAMQHLTCEHCDTVNEPMIDPEILEEGFDKMSTDLIGIEKGLREQREQSRKALSATFAKIEEAREKIRKRIMLSLILVIIQSFTLGAWVAFNCTGNFRYLSLITTALFGLLVVMNIRVISTGCKLLAMPLSLMMDQTI